MDQNSVENAENLVEDSQVLVDKTRNSAWECRICHTKVKTGKSLCPNCNLSKEEVKNKIWVCARKTCKNINLVEDLNCTACNWKQKHTINLAEMITRAQLLERLQNIKEPNMPKTSTLYIHVLTRQLRMKAFISLLYLTAGRVSELCNRKDHQHTGAQVVSWGIRKSQIEFETLDGVMTMLIKNVVTLKRRPKRGVEPLRTIQVLVESEEPFVKYITDYLEVVKSEDSFLFPQTRQGLYMMIRKHIKIHPHMLRHMRTTELITKYDFTTEMIFKHNNYASIASITPYMHIRNSDLTRAMISATKRRTQQ